MSETQSVAAKEQAELYTSGKERGERLGQIERLSDKVLEDRNITRQNGYIAATFSELSSAADRIMYVGLDIDNMGQVKKGLVKGLTWLQLISPYKRVENKKKKILESVSILEGIVHKTNRKLEHPKRGMYSELDKLEVYRDDSIDLRRLCKEEITDLHNEAEIYQQMFNNKEYGEGKEYASAQELRNQLRATRKSIKTVTKLKSNANNKFRQADVNVRGLQNDITKLEALVITVDDKVSEMRTPLVVYRSDKEITDHVMTIGKVLKEDLQDQMKEYIKDMEDLNSISGEVWEGIDGIGGFAVPQGDESVEEYDPNGVITASRQKEEALDSLVEARINQIEEEPFFV